MSGELKANRRNFLQATAAVGAAQLAAAGGVYAAGSDAVKVGLIGCGGRGSGAAGDSIEADKAVRVVALADVFSSGPKGVHVTRQQLAGKGHKIDDDHVFVGFDAYKKLLALDLDYVILATPPYFRPEHIRAAIEAGKHVFTEKPVAVDPPGARSVMQSAEQAKKKGLSIVAGTQRRHQEPYLETYKRILDGAIGQIVAARCYWNGGKLWHTEREGAKDMEWMIRNWVNWCWLSGDHIVEQHVHNLDVINWFLSKDGTAVHPLRAVGMGGRARRVTGDQFDFFSIDYEYEGGVHVSSYCRQINGCAGGVTEAVVGSLGRTHSEQSGRCFIEGAKAWRWPQRQKFTNPYVQEHIDLIDSIRKGKGLNEGKNVATSTLTAIMGRISAYTGKAVTWDEMMSSDLKLGPKDVSWDTALLPEVPPVPGFLQA